MNTKLHYPPLALSLFAFAGSPVSAIIGFEVAKTATDKDAPEVIGFGIAVLLLFAAIFLAVLALALWLYGRNMNHRSPTFLDSTNKCNKTVIEDLVRCSEG